MKLSDHVEQIRSSIYKSFSNQFARLGVGASKLVDSAEISADLQDKRAKIEVLIDSHTGETGSYADAREKALDELTFTLFNRLAAIKVMEAHQLFPPIVTKEAENGDRSFGHKMWLEQNGDMRSAELEGIREYFKHEFNQLGESIPLFHKDYPYAFLPYVIELNEIIEAFNAVSKDSQVEDEIWQSDDILGWLYESYNTLKRIEIKALPKIEFDVVKIQACLYTPRWVVEFLVQNSLGKLYLEMYPDSEIKQRFKIANAPEKRVRELKPLHEIKLIDPASGSGNFLLYAFEFFYTLYLDQIDHYEADYDEDEIPQLIIENNLYGVDLDDRAIQLAQLGLWIKAKQKQRSTGSLKFNVVSSDFFLPDFGEVQHIFEGGTTGETQLRIVEDIWSDLQQAHKFGSLVRLEEKLSIKFHGQVENVSSTQVTIFGKEDIQEYERFKTSFFTNLETAVAQYAIQEGNSFLTDKTKDAITFLRLITQRYDIAAANPPYTSSRDFGPELKGFIESNYRKPYKFHKNLYAVFLKRCLELTNEKGKIAMIHPHTFMFIKDYIDVRRYIIENTHIDIVVDFGLDRVNLFGPGILLDATFYVLSKELSEKKGLYFNLISNLQEKFKKDKFIDILKNKLLGVNDERVFELEQNKLKSIKSWPFIYWVSESFRAKFSTQTIDEISNVGLGLKTANNNKFLRFWWEVTTDDISVKLGDQKKWVVYLKGGTFNKWVGNEWLVIDWQKDGEKVRNQKNSQMIENGMAFREGITVSTRSNKGVCGRLFEENRLYDMAASSILPNDNTNILFWLAYSNSKLFTYILKCLNPTVNKQPEDIRRLPAKIDNRLIGKTQDCIEIKKYLLQYDIFSLHFNQSILTSPEFLAGEIRQGMKSFFDKENQLLCQVIIAEAVIDDDVFNIYKLNPLDRKMVLAKEGESIGALAISNEAKQAFLSNENVEFPLDNIRAYIDALPEKAFENIEREVIEIEFPQLYQSNNDLVEFCIRHKINPINVWYWFRESDVIPKQRMNDLAMEFLADMLREILMEDEDGIIPLVPNAGEIVLLDRIEEKFIEKGFSMAQYSSFDSVLGRELNEYINNHFFEAFSDHLNLFMYLPKTPFIWHLTSGPEQGFDCYIIIYKWSRDRLLSIRSVYIEQRERSLENRQSDLRAKSTLSASEQNELDKIYKQLKEIESFKQKIDELLAEGYNPILDDGVGKNIAPLQNKKMIAYDVLNAGQLKKYLNADW